MGNIISSGRPFATNLTDFSHDILLYSLTPKFQTTFGYHKVIYFYFCVTNEKLLFITFFKKNGKDYSQNLIVLTFHQNDTTLVLKNTLLDS
jgi:hypothetical protein